MRQNRNKAIVIGMTVEPYGKVAAVGSLQGERYYWLVDEYGDVAMMPADVIEILGE